MKFYNEKKPLYFETATSAVGLGNGLFQVRNGMSYPTGEAPENILTHSICQ